MEEDYIFDYGKLRGRIKEIFGTQEEFAKLICMSKATLSAKLNNSSEFSQCEICKASELLRIELSEIPQYFFASKFRKTKQ